MVSCVLSTLPRSLSLEQVWHASLDASRYHLALFLISMRLSNSMSSQHTQKTFDLLYHREWEIRISLMQFIHLVHRLMSLVLIIFKVYDNLTL